MKPLVIQFHRVIAVGDLFDCSLLLIVNIVHGFILFMTELKPIMRYVKNCQTTEETLGSDMVAGGIMEVHTAHETTDATSMPFMETPKALG